MSTPLKPELQALLQRRNTVSPIYRATLTFGTTTESLTVVSGSVTLDRRRVQRGTMTMDVRVGGSIPTGLTPLGGSITIEMGIRSVRGDIDFVPLMTDGVITSVDGPELPGAVLSVQVSERSERVARWRFEQPFTLPANITLSQAVNRVLTNRGLPTNFTSFGPTLRAARVFGLEAEKDPWAETYELCESLGWRLWMGRDGLPRLDQIPVAGEARELLVLEPRISMSSRPYNVIVGRWTPTNGDPPVYAIAVDDNPASPTFVGGPYGRVTMYFASSLPISQGGANQAVQTILNSKRYQGAGRTWTTGFDPTIDPDDVVKASNFTHLSSAIVEAVTINFGGNTTLELSELPS